MEATPELKLSADEWVGVDPVDAPSPPPSEKQPSLFYSDSERGGVVCDVDEVEALFVVPSQKEQADKASSSEEPAIFVEDEGVSSCIAKSSQGDLSEGGALLQEDHVDEYSESFDADESVKSSEASPDRVSPGGLGGARTPPGEKLLSPERAAAPPSDGAPSDNTTVVELVKPVAMPMSAAMIGGAPDADRSVDWDGSPTARLLAPGPLGEEDSTPRPGDSEVVHLSPAAQDVLLPAGGAQKPPSHFAQQEEVVQVREVELDDAERRDAVCSAVLEDLMEEAWVEVAAERAEQRQLQKSLQQHQQPFYAVTK